MTWHWGVSAEHVWRLFHPKPTHEHPSPNRPNYFCPHVAIRPQAEDDHFRASLRQRADSPRPHCRRIFAADIHVRHLRSMGEDVLWICGSDEHGAAITLRAKKEGTTPREIVDTYHVEMQKAFAGLDISFDHYSRTSSPKHHEVAQDFFLTLLEKGGFEVKTEAQFYDEEAKQFLADRYIQGTCPACGHDGAYGDQCEKCGKTLAPPSSSTRAPRLAAPHRCSSPRRFGTSRWGGMKTGCGNTSWTAHSTASRTTTPRNGRPTCWGSAARGSTAASKAAP